MHENVKLEYFFSCGIKNFVVWVMEMQEKFAIIIELLFTQIKAFPDTVSVSEKVESIIRDYDCVEGFSKVKIHHIHTVI